MKLIFKLLLLLMPLTGCLAQPLTAQTFSKTRDTLYLDFSKITAESLLEASNGHLIVAGGDVGNTEGALLIINGANGDVLNNGRTRFNAPISASFQQFLAIAEGVSGAGYAVIGNTTNVKKRRDGWVVRLDENGNRINPNAPDVTFGNATTDDFLERIVATDTTFWVFGHQNDKACLIAYTDKLGEVHPLSKQKMGNILTATPDLAQGKLHFAGDGLKNNWAFMAEWNNTLPIKYQGFGTTNENGILRVMHMISPTSVLIFGEKEAGIATGLFDTEGASWTNKRLIEVEGFKTLKQVIRLDNGKYLAWVLAKNIKNGALRNKFLLINPFNSPFSQLVFDAGDDFTQPIFAATSGFNNTIWLVGRGRNTEGKLGLRLIKLEMQADRASIITGNAAETANQNQLTPKSTLPTVAPTSPPVNCPQTVLLDLKNRVLASNETRKVSFSINSATDIAVEFISKTSGLVVPNGERYFKTKGNEVLVSFQISTATLTSASATIQIKIKTQGNVWTCPLELPCNEPLSKTPQKLKPNYDDPLLNKGKPMVVDVPTATIAGKVLTRPLPPGTQLVVEVQNAKKDEQVQVSGGELDINGDTYFNFVVAVNNLKDNDNVVILTFQTPDGKDKRTDTLHILCNLRNMNLHLLTIAPPSNLKYNKKDATDITTVLRKQMRVDPSKRVYNAVCSHQFDTKDSTTRDELFSLFDDLPRRLNQSAPLFPKDILVVFISAHGKMVEEKNASGRIEKRFKIIPSNHRDNDKITVDFERDISTKLSELGCKVIVLLDACYSGGAKSSTDEDLLRVLNALNNTPSGVVILSSSTAIQESFENPELKNGAFTRALLEAFGHYTEGASAADVDANGWLSLEEIWQYVSWRVPEIVHPKDSSGKALNLPIERRQTPYISRRDFDLSKEFFRLR
jgi:hypothetical protein